MVGFPDNCELREMYDRRDKLDAHLRQEATARTRGFRSEPPTYLLKALGPPPAGGWARDRWEGMATTIEHHRLRWDITDPTDVLGERAGDGRSRRSSEFLRDEIRRTVEYLHRDRAQPRALRRAR